LTTARILLNIKVRAIISLEDQTHKVDSIVFTEREKNVVDR